MCIPGTCKFDTRTVWRMTFYRMGQVIARDVARLWTTCARTNANTRARANKAGREALDFGSHCGRFCLVCNAHVIIHSDLADYEPGSEIPLCARMQYHCCHSKVRDARRFAADEEGWCRPLVKPISWFVSYFLL